MQSTLLSAVVLRGGKGVLRGRGKHSSHATRISQQQNQHLILSGLQKQRQKQRQKQQLPKTTTKTITAAITTTIAITITTTTTYYYRNWMQASKLHLQRQMTGGNKGLNTWRTRSQHHPSPPPAPTTTYPLPVTHLTTTNRSLSLSSWLPSLTLPCPPPCESSLSLSVCKCLSPAGVLNVEQGGVEVGAASLSAPWREKPSQVATHKWPRQMLFYLGKYSKSFLVFLEGEKHVEIY